MFIIINNLSPIIINNLFIFEQTKMRIDIKNCFRKLDIFAPNYEFAVQDNLTRFKSNFGALFSIITILLAFSYGSLRFV